MNLLLGFGPTILLIVGFVWLTNRAGQASGGGLFGIGRSRAKRYDEALDQLFKQAREAPPAIIFIDELDAIGRPRGGSASFSGNSDTCSRRRASFVRW